MADGEAGLGPAPQGRAPSADLLDHARALALRHPRLLHMTEAGSGEAIRAGGLWSTSALLERDGLHGEARAAIEASRRAASVTLPSGAVIRDNGVLSEARLAPLLPEGVAPRDWYLLLNAHVFLWPSEARVAGLLKARAYRKAAHDVLEFDAASLLAAHAARVRVTPMNTGATIQTTPERGPEAFLPLADWPPTTSSRYWSTPGGTLRPIKEVAVLGGIPDADDHLVAITRRRAGEKPVTIWRR